MHSAGEIFMKSKACVTGVLMTFLMATELAVAAGPQAGEWFVRLRPSMVDPQNRSQDTVRLNGLNIQGGQVSVDEAGTLAIDIDYMITRNIGLDIMLDTSSDHDIHGRGSLNGLGKIAETKVLPPALWLNYYFFAEKKFRPYLGAGIGYVIFFDQEADGSLEAVLGGRSNLDVDNTPVSGGQIGFDFDITDRWFLTANFKATRMRPRAEIQSRNLANKINVDVNIDPFIYGVGVGYRF